MGTFLLRAARVASMVFAAISVSVVSISCASHTGAIPPPAAGTSAGTSAGPGELTSAHTGGTHSGARTTRTLPPGEAVPDSGCNYYSNGDIVCASNCTGSWDGAPGTGSNTTTCTTSSGSSGSVGGPGPGSGGSTRVGNPFLNTGNNTIVGSGLTYAQRIYNSMQSFKSTHSARNSTLNFGGASAGNECVTTIQAILAGASLAQIANNTNNVPAFEAALPNSGYVQVSQSQAVPGDFVVESGQAHLGMCETNGCSYIISNSSTPESFTWETTADAYSAYFHGHTLRFWHHSP